MKLMIIGHGAIGCWLIDAIAREDGVDVGWIIVRESRRAEVANAVGTGIRVVTSVADLAAAGEHPDYVIEAAGHSALGTHGIDCLRQGWPLAVVSVGALSDQALLTSLKEVAELHGGTIDLLPGAVGAIDALSAARGGGLDEVVYTGRKPPEGWRGSPAEEIVDLDAIDSETCLFEGSARDAAARFPKNANVAATIGLAGIGLDETRVRLVADPSAVRNIHEVIARGAFGELKFKIEGRSLPDNPRTSALTAMSILRQIRNRAGVLRV